MTTKSISNWIEEKLNSYVILTLLVFAIFFVPIFNRPLQEILDPILNIGIFLTVIFIGNKNRRLIFTIILFSIILRWILAPLLSNDNFRNATQLINLVIFIYAVFQLIISIAKSEAVKAKVVIDAINGYLILGLAFSHLVHFTESFYPGAFSFEDADLPFSMYNYFSFVTLSTLGYGDVTPQMPISRSLATLIAVSGQMYMAIIIALIVGKFAASGQMNNSKP